MAYGLETYYGDSQVGITANIRTMRFFWDYQISATNGSVAVPGWQAASSGFVLVWGNRLSGASLGNIWMDSNVLRWSNIETAKVAFFYHR